MQWPEKLYSNYTLLGMWIAYLNATVHSPFKVEW
jgi:hypothetical protein